MDLKKVQQLSITRTLIDYNISEGTGVGTPADAFLQRVKKIDGINRFSKHNHLPSLATDIYIYHHLCREVTGKM